MMVREVSHLSRVTDLISGGAGIHNCCLAQIFDEAIKYFGTIKGRKRVIKIFGLSSVDFMICGLELKMIHT